MVFIKVYLPFLYSSMNLFFCKDSADFRHRKMALKIQNFAIFDIQYQIKPSTLNIVMAVFIDLWPC